MSFRTVLPLMPLRMLTLFALAASAGCSSIAPTGNLPAQGLPTAVPPSNVGGPAGDWALPFEFEFPAGFWAEGLHRYGFLFSCPAIGQEVSGTEWRIFQVTQESPLQEEPIYIRLQGLSHGRLAASFFDIIHPDQQTVAVVTFVGLTEQTAQAASAASDCEVLIRWDDVATQSMTAGEPYLP